MFWLDLTHYCNYCSKECLSTPQSKRKASDDYLHQMQLLLVNVDNHLHVIDSIGINKRIVKNILLDINPQADFYMEYDPSNSTLTIYISQDIFLTQKKSK